MVDEILDEKIINLQLILPVTISDFIDFGVVNALARAEHVQHFAFPAVQD